MCLGQKQLSAPLEPVGKIKNRRKWGMRKSFDAIEKLVRGQMWAKMFSTKSSHPFSRQARWGSNIMATLSAINISSLAGLGQI